MRRAGPAAIGRLLRKRALVPTTRQDMPVWLGWAMVQWAVVWTNVHYEKKKLIRYEMTDAKSNIEYQIFTLPIFFVRMRLLEKLPAGCRTEEVSGRGCGTAPHGLPWWTPLARSATRAKAQPSILVLWNIETFPAVFPCPSKGGEGVVPNDPQSLTSGTTDKVVGCDGRCRWTTFVTVRISWSMKEDDEDNDTSDFPRRLWKNRVSAVEDIILWKWKNIHIEDIIVTLLERLLSWFCNNRMLQLNFLHVIETSYEKNSKPAGKENLKKRVTFARR